MQIPQSIAVSLEEVGGLGQVSRNIPRGGRIRAATTVFGSLSDPIRLSILHALAVTPLCVCVLKSLVKVGDSKLSYHLARLKSARLIAQQSQGKFIVYNITELGLKMISASQNIK